MDLQNEHFQATINNVYSKMEAKIDSKLMKIFFGNLIKLHALTQNIKICTYTKSNHVFNFPP